MLIDFAGIWRKLIQWKISWAGILCQHHSTYKKAECQNFFTNQKIPLCPDVPAEIGKTSERREIWSQIFFPNESFEDIPLLMLVKNALEKIQQWCL